MSNTVVVGATTNPSRYAFMAAKKLLAFDHNIVLIGIKKGEIDGHHIQPIYEKPTIENVDTVTLYVGANNQKDHIPYLLSLKPRRIIFNPGTENPQFMEEAKKHNIEVEVACTLVMLSAGTY